MANTTNYSWSLPTVGGNQDAWGDLLNDNWEAIDTLLGGVNATEFGILDGATVTTDELNVLDGITATTAELNYVDGVTSNVQTQLDNLSNTKAPIASPTFTGQVNAGDSVRLGDWVIFDNGGTIYFQYNGNNVFAVDSSGNTYAEGNVTAYTGV